MIVGLPERMASRIVVDESTGCWDWQAALNNHGYGRVSWGGKSASAHRVTYHLLVDETLPVYPGGPHVGLQLDHVCANRRCVNPSHLEPVTHAENRRRSALRNPRPTRLAEDDPRHGRRAGYTHWGCRCEACRAAHRAAMRQWRAAQQLERAA